MYVYKLNCYDTLVSQRVSGYTVIVDTFKYFQVNKNVDEIIKLTYKKT